MASAADAVNNVLASTPPVIRFYAGVTFVVSLAVHVMHLVGVHRVIWHPFFIMEKFPPQLWRAFTSFFLTAPQLQILFDTFTIYKYGSDLEAIHFNTSGDFVWYLLFNGFVILLLNTFITGGVFFAPEMGIAMAYSWGQRNRGRNIKFWFVTLKAQWLPYAIVAITAIQSPGSAFMLLTGIASAHAYEFLTVIWPRFGGGTNLLPTPSFLKWSFEGGPGTRSAGAGGVRAYGTGFDPRNRDAAPAPARPQGMFSGDGGRATGSNTGYSAGSAWRNRGTGHRLGSD